MTDCCFQPSYSSKQIVQLKPLSVRAHHLGIYTELQAAFNVAQSAIHHVCAAGGSHEAPLGPLVRVLVVAFAHGHVGRAPVFVAYTLQAPALFFQRAAAAEIKFDLEEGDIHNATILRQGKVFDVQCVKHRIQPVVLATLLEHHAQLLQHPYRTLVGRVCCRNHPLD